SAMSGCLRSVLVSGGAPRLTRLRLRSRLLQSAARPDVRRAHRAREGGRQPPRARRPRGPGAAERVTVPWYVRAVRSARTVKEPAMTDRPDLVIDGDGHVIEVNETYERIDPKYRERRPVYTQASRGYIVRLVDGKVWGPDTERGFVGVNGNLGPPKGKAIQYRRMGPYNPWALHADV